MSNGPKKLAVLGSTGVIGRYALEVAEPRFRIRFQVVGLAAGQQCTDLLEGPR